MISTFKPSADPLLHVTILEGHYGTTEYASYRLEQIATLT
jgi:hypothetical protein